MIEFGLGLVAGFGLYWVHDWLVNRQVKAAIQGQWGKKGKEKQALINDRMAQATLEAFELFKSGKLPVDIAKELLPKYPDVALQLGKKLGGKGLEGLI